MTTNNDAGDTNNADSNRQEWASISLYPETRDTLRQLRDREGFDNYDQLIRDRFDLPPITTDRELLPDDTTRDDSDSDHSS